MQTTASDTRTTSRLTYAIDSEHAVAHFRVRHLMISHVRGELGKIVGEAKIDPRNLARSELFTMIDAVAIDTRNPQRDEHLRSADFLMTDEFPVITFRSTEVDRTTACAGTRCWRPAALLSATTSTSPSSSSSPESRIAYLPS